MPRCCLSLTLCLLAIQPVLAESKTFEFTVTAGERERVNVPVRVLLPVPAALGKTEAVTLQGADGKAITAQLTGPGLLAEKTSGDGVVPRELHFILPSLKAGASAVFRATISSEPAAKTESFSWNDTPGDNTELRFGARPVLRYMYKALDDSSKEKRELTYKVFHHLYDPDGTRLVTKGPGGQYTHHRGIYYGFNKVTYGDNQKADIWHCTGDTHQSHEKFLASEAGPVLGRHRLEIAWHGQGKKVFAVEERELTVYHVAGGQLLEFASRLRSTGGKITLDGDPQHAGFHFRADNEVAAKTNKQTYFLRPDGQDKPGATRNWDHKARDAKSVNLPWNAMSFVLGQERYTAGYLDRPANPKEARYSERDYGRFGSYFEHELTEAKPLDVNYRLWLQKGEMKGEQMERLSADFTQPMVVKVK